MKGQFKGFVIGLLLGAFVLSGIAAIATDALKTLENVKVGGIRIVIDDKEFTCTDASGAVVEPMIYNGTTYIPVRAVSTAFGKAVYWDGEESTIYLGNMNGKLEKPTATFDDLTNVGSGARYFNKKSKIKDNYGNFYHTANFCNLMSGDYSDCCEYLLDKKYSTFKATLFIPDGAQFDSTQKVFFVGDGKEIGSVIEMDKTSKCVDVEVDITDVNDFKMVFDSIGKIYVANAGFYQ